MGGLAAWTCCTDVVHSVQSASEKGPLCVVVAREGATLGRADKRARVTAAPVRSSATVPLPGQAWSRGCRFTCKVRWRGCRARGMGAGEGSFRGVKCVDLLQKSPRMNPRTLVSENAPAPGTPSSGTSHTAFISDQTWTNTGGLHPSSASAGGRAGPRAHCGSAQTSCTASPCAASCSSVHGEPTVP
jgi:hypothetical protein